MYNSPRTLIKIKGEVHMSHTFLSHRHFSQLKIIEFLLENSTATISQLEKITGCSKQTVIAYLEELESDMDFFSYKKKNDLIGVVTNNQLSYSSIYHYFYDQSLSLQILEIIFLNPYIYTSDLINILGISKSNFTRIKSQLDKQLMVYDLSITNSPFVLTGELKNLVSFFVSYMYEKYTFSSEFISVEQNNLLQHIITSFSNVSHLNGPQDTHRLTIWLWVVIKIFCHTPNSIQTNHIQSTQTHHVLVNENRFSEAFGFNYSPTLHLIISRLFTLLTTEDSSTIIYKLNSIEHFLSILYSIFNVDTSNISLAPYRVVLLLYTGKNFILNNEKKRFVLAYFKRDGHFPEHIALTLRKELKLLKNTIKDEHLFFELLYLMLTHESKLIDQIQKNQIKPTVGILYTFDLEHSQLIQIKLSELFHNFLDFQVVGYDFFAPFDDTLFNCDYYLTNLLIINNPNCIITDIYPTEHDIEQLISTFKKNTPNLLFDYLNNL